MSKYLVEVRYTVDGYTLNQTRASRAKGRQFVKEQFHRYMHENYPGVSRENEDSHVLQINDSTLTVELENIHPVDEIDLQNNAPLRRV